MRAYVVVCTIYVVIAGGIVLCVIAAIYAGRHRRLFIEDFGTVLLIPILFLLIAGYRDLAMGLIVWPIVLAVILMYAFAAKVSFVDRPSGHAHRNSKWLFYSALFCAVGAAVVLPPWYE